MATVAKGYDLDYAWRAVGEAYRGAGYYLAAAEAGEPPGTWWGPGAERLGFAAGQQVEREPYNLLFGQRKGPAGQKLGRAPANAGKAAARPQTQGQEAVRRRNVLIDPYTPNFASDSLESWHVFVS